MSHSILNVINSDSNILYLNNLTTNGTIISAGGGTTTIGSSSALTISATGILTVQNSSSIGDIISFTGTGGTVNFNGDITLYNSTKNTIAFRNTGINPPSFTTRSDGTKILLYPSLTGLMTDFAIGIQSLGIWNSVPSSTQKFYWYAGTTEIMRLDGSGILNVNGTTDASSISTGSIITPGGVGITKSLYVGTDVNLAVTSGITTIGSSSSLMISATGILTVQNSSSIGDIVSFTGTGGTVNFNGDITLYNLTKNTIAFRDVGSAPPSFTTRSNGTKIVLYPTLSGLLTDYAIGIEPACMWMSIPSSFQQFCWYAGTSQIMNLDGASTGILTIYGTVSSTSKTTGSLLLTGGIGINNTTDASSVINGGTFTTGGGLSIAKKLYVGTDVNLAVTSGITTIGSSTALTISATGVLTVNNITDSSSVSTGSIIILGGVGIAKSLYVGGPFDVISSKSGIPSTTGQYLRISSSTFTDNNTASSGTASSMVFNSIAVPTLNATNTTVTTTNAATMYIAGGPTSGTNQTITNSYGLWNVGQTRLDGFVGIGTTPQSALHIVGTRNNFPTVKGIHMGEGGTDDYAIEICATTSSNNSYIDFTYASGIDYRGRIIYTHSNDTFNIYRSGSGTSSLTINSIGISTPNVLTITNTTDSSSITTGATIISGGVGIAKKLYVGTDVNLAVTSGITIIGSSTSLTISATGILTVNNTTDSSSVSTGSTIVLGGVGIAKSLYVGTDTNLAATSGTTTIGSLTALTISATGVLTVNNTSNSSGSGTGALIVLGGASITNNLYVNSKNITPNTEDITKEITFTGANNTVSATNVTSLVFTISITRSFEILMTVIVVATSSLYAQFKLLGIYNGSSWYFASSYIGDDTQVIFTITNAGQVQYTSGNYSGFSSLTMKFRGITISV